MVQHPRVIEVINEQEWSIIEIVTRYIVPSLS